MGIVEFFTKKKLKEEIRVQKERIVSLEKERNELRKVMKEIGGLDLIEIKKEIEKTEESKNIKLQDIENCINTITALELEIKNRKNEIVELDEEILLQSFGLYKPRYEYLKTSEEFKLNLDKIREQQKIKVKEGTAASCATIDACIRNVLFET
jgi:chromosome segregation ATPase